MKKLTEVTVKVHHRAPGISEVADYPVAIDSIVRCWPSFRLQMRDSMMDDILAEVRVNLKRHGYQMIEDHTGFA
jgi:hypothetical protein